MNSDFEKRIHGGSAAISWTRIAPAEAAGADFAALASRH